MKIGDRLIINDISQKILFEPAESGLDTICILTSYATPNMLSWYIDQLSNKTINSIKINLIIGMVPCDDISVSAHKGFCDLVSSKCNSNINTIRCSYITDRPAEHCNIYVWCDSNKPKVAFNGSANFVQSSFVSNIRSEIMNECDPVEAMNYYRQAEAKSIYCNHSEVEEYVKLIPTHPILDLEYNLVDNTESQELEFVVLSLLSRSGEPAKRSGLNWGQRKGREPNQAYIPLPRKIAKTGFFPLDKRHFTVVTDDRHQLILRVEQQGDKAITTPERNSDLGEYFRNRLGLANGVAVTKQDLERYGRTDVKFIKLDDETYYMDFSK